MPLYVYQCNECDFEFEKMVRFSEASDPQACPDCHGEDTRKKITTFASIGGSLSSVNVFPSSSCGTRGGFS